MSDLRLVVRDLHVRHRGAPSDAVRGVELELRAGESLGVVGASGSGKTTLVRALLGLVPSRGTILWDGRSLADRLASDRLDFRRRVQLLLQTPLHAFDPRRTIGREIHDALRLHRRPTADVPHLMSRVGLAPAFAGRRPHTLSGGELQRGALARALATGPEVLILDEALVSLDPVSRGEIVDLLLDLQQKSSLTYLWVAHDLGMVGALCDRIAVMDGGRIVEAGETSRVLTGPRESVTRHLLAASPRWNAARIGGKAIG